MTSRARSRGNEAGLLFCACLYNAGMPDKETDAQTCCDATGRDDAGRGNKRGCCGCCCGKKKSGMGPIVSGIFAVLLALFGAFVGSYFTRKVSSQLQMQSQSEAMQIAAFDHMTAYTRAYQRWRYAEYIADADEQMKRYLEHIRENPVRGDVGSQRFGYGNNVIDAWKDVTDDENWQEMTSQLIAMSILYPESKIDGEMMALTRAALFMNHIKAKKAAEDEYFETLGTNELRLEVINTPYEERVLEKDSSGAVVQTERNKIIQSRHRRRLLVEHEKSFESDLEKFHRHLVDTIWPKGVTREISKKNDAAADNKE